MIQRTENLLVWGNMSIILHRTVMVNLHNYSLKYFEVILSLNPKNLTFFIFKLALYSLCMYIYIIHSTQNSSSPFAFCFFFAKVVDQW